MTSTSVIEVFRCGRTTLAGVGDFVVLAEELDAQHRLLHWASRTPQLAQIGSVANLLRWREEHSPQECDDMLAALVWWASVEGGDDQDAVLVLLHVMGPGVRTLAGRMRALCGDNAQLVVISEMTVQARLFPWQRRTRAVAANLMLDTQAALMREWVPCRTVNRQQVKEWPCDPWELRDATGETVELASSAQPTVAGMAQWATNTGLLDEQEALMLTTLAEPDSPALENGQEDHCSTQPNSAPQPNPLAQHWASGLRAEKPKKTATGNPVRPELQLASRYGVSVRTIERRKAHALSVLRQARFLFLAQAA